MWNFDLAIVNSVVYLLIAGCLMLVFGQRVSISRQHEFAFAAILILVIAILPQLQMPQVAPGIVLCLGMMLFALHTSAYYSGTPKNSARLYAVLLFQSALMLAMLIHPLIKESSIGKLFLMGGTGYFLLMFERIIVNSRNIPSRLEYVIFSLWILVSIIGSWNSNINVLPDLLFLLLILVHLEKRWQKQDVPAPLVTLYGTIILWYAHFAMIDHFTLGKTITSNTSIISSPIVLTLFLSSILIWRSVKTKSYTKKILYFFFVQETIIIGLRIGNIFIPDEALYGLHRYLLFVALMGMFVMIESTEGTGINAKLFQGIFYERPRFTFVFLSLLAMFVLYPGVHLGSWSKGPEAFLLGIILTIGIIITVQLGSMAFEQSNRKHRIIRPSLSIWSTVVFTILWSAVTILETMIRIWQA